MVRPSSSLQSVWASVGRRAQDIRTASEAHDGLNQARQRAVQLRAARGHCWPQGGGVACSGDGHSLSRASMETTLGMRCKSENLASFTPIRLASSLSVGTLPVRAWNLSLSLRIASSLSCRYAGIRMTRL
eukprot:scaffold1727_cov119-Isochrysis_galbana.AAC.11